jgi:glycosyltransferase involved in cell wall biosynthesis
MRLSICIATFNRAGYIAQTLESVLDGLPRDVEVVVVDGASSDGTRALMEAYAGRDPRIAYHREAQNLGVDRDFDKAVGYARGEYCWLMSDDDVLVPGAVAAVLRGLEDDPGLLIVNAQIRTRDLSGVLKDNQLELAADREFGAGDEEALFDLTSAYLSFIGAVVIRRDAWLARERAAYFDTQFIHVGVIFQPPALPRVRVLAQPLVQIRYGNASWSARGFDIWVRKWPRLVWSFDRFSEAVRARVTAREPARSAKSLLWFRAIGAFGPQELAAMRQAGESHHALAGAIAALPARAANAGVALYMYARRHADARVMLYDLLRAKCASGTARWVARRFRFPETER